MPVVAPVLVVVVVLGVITPTINSSVVGSRSERSELWGLLKAAITACDGHHHSIQQFLISTYIIMYIKQ